MIVKVTKDTYFKIALFAIELTGIILAAVFAKDNALKIAISLSGLCFNFLTCYGMRYGFLIGVGYALMYTVMAFMDKIYASAVFMLIVQAPMAVMSFINWSKQKNNVQESKKLSKKQSIIIAAAFPVAIGAIFGILYLLKSNGALTDSIFFAITLMSCILLIKRYRAAYLFVGLSGLSGVALWAFQMVQNKTGLSLLVLYACVLLNSLGAIKEQYFAKKTADILPTASLDENIAAVAEESANISKEELIATQLKENITLAIDEMACSNLEEKDSISIEEKPTANNK